MTEREPIKTTGGMVIPVQEKYAEKYKRGGAQPIAVAGQVCEFDGVKTTINEGYVGFDPKAMASLDWDKVNPPQTRKKRTRKSNKS
jgi:hypothetical protein